MSADIVNLDSGYITITNNVTKTNSPNPAIYNGNWAVGGTLGINGTLATGTKNYVSQATSITSPVTVNGTSGYVITYSTSLAANNSNIFTVNNNVCTATSLVFLSVIGFSGSSINLPVVAANVVNNGSFEIAVNNVTATAYSGTITIAFLIIN